MRSSSYLLPSCLLCFGLICLSAIALADDKSSRELLKSKGLQKSVNRFVLAEEIALRQELREAELLKKKVDSTQRDAAMWRSRVTDKKQLIIDYIQKRRELRAQLAYVKTAKANNRIALTLNELSDRIVLMQTSDQFEQKLQEARVAAHQEMQNYVERLMEARRLHGVIAEGYKALETDDEVKKAIAEYGKADGRQYKLGPSSTFLSSEEKLKKLEQTALSEDIDIRKDRSGLWYIPVTFNGKYTKEMAIDTGASLIAMSWNMATAVGLTPTEKSPIMHVTVADGRKLEARQIIAPKVRIGKFTVENVRCAVMPPEYTNAPALLGQSFLEHFIYKIDTVNSKLVMTKVEADDNKKQPRTKRKRR